MVVYVCKWWRRWKVANLWRQSVFKIDHWRCFACSSRYRKKNSFHILASAAKTFQIWSLHKLGCEKFSNGISNRREDDSQLRQTLDRLNVGEERTLIYCSTYPIFHFRIASRLLAIHCGQEPTSLTKFRAS